MRSLEPKDLSEVLALCDEALKLDKLATPGPWSAALNAVSGVVLNGRDGIVAYTEEVRDALSIAKARTTNPLFAQMVKAVLELCEYETNAWEQGSPSTLKLKIREAILSVFEGS